MIGDFPLAHNFTLILNFIALILNFIATCRGRSNKKRKLEAKSMTSIKWLISLQVSSQLRYENCYPLKRLLAIYYVICVYYGSMRESVTNYAYICHFYIVLWNFQSHVMLNFLLDFRRGTFQAL